MIRHDDSARGRNSRGFSTLEALIAIVLAGACFSALAMALHVSARLFAGQIADRMVRAGLDALADRWVNEAETAAAMYTVSSCGGGACPGFRFMAFDQRRRPHFWGYELIANAGLQRCAYDTPEGPCKATGSLFAVAAFEARPLLASSLDLAIARGYRAADRVYRLLGAAEDPGRRVVGGNRLMRVTIDGDIAGRTIDLLPGSKPFDASAVVAYVTPPPNPTSPVSTPSPASSCGPQCALYSGATYSEFYCWGSLYQSPHGGAWVPRQIEVDWSVYYYSADAGRTWGGFAAKPMVHGTCAYPPSQNLGDVHEWWALPFETGDSNDPPVASPLSDSTTIGTDATGGAGYRTIVMADGFQVDGTYVLFPGQSASIAVSATAGTSIVMSENPTGPCDGYVSLTPAPNQVQGGAVATYTLKALKPTGSTSPPASDTFPTCDVAWAADGSGDIPPQATFIAFAVVPEGTPLL